MSQPRRAKHDLCCAVLACACWSFANADTAAPAPAPVPASDPSASPMLIPDAGSDNSTASLPVNPPGNAPGDCGNERYRLTLCFPGSPQNATCTYNLEANATTDELRPHSPQKPCPQAFLFGEACEQMEGSIYFAFGPCNSDDVPEPQRADNTKDVTDWIDTMGLRTATVLGGMFVRGYAYQRGYSTTGINLFPNLETLRPPRHLELGGKQYTQVTFSGLATPALPEISSIPSGLSILDSPDVDFSTPRRFQRLINVTNGISIAGCTNLRSLSGLEGLVGEEMVTNILIVYNPILEDISALSGLFKCQGSSSSSMQPDSIVGTVAVHPLALQPAKKACILNTANKICQYIHDKTQCPAGTESDVASQNDPFLIPGTPTPG